MNSDFLRGAMTKLHLLSGICIFLGLLGACMEVNSAPRNRVVLVFDPTLYAADSAAVERQVLQPLEAELARLPSSTWIDLYLVKPEGNVRGGADYRDSVPFDPYATSDSVVKRTVARSVVDQAREAWRTARLNTKARASCILSALRRTELAPVDRLRAVQEEKVILVLVSDLREVCRDFGEFDLEHTVPERFSSLPADVDLSHFSAAHLLLADGLTNRNAATDARIETLWTDLLQRWRIRGPVSVVNQLPADLFNT